MLDGTTLGSASGFNPHPAHRLGATGAERSKGMSDIVSILTQLTGWVLRSVNCSFAAIDNVSILTQLTGWVLHPWVWVYEFKRCVSILTQLTGWVLRG